MEAHGRRVQGGPFAGMTYPASAVGRTEQLVAKLLGAYECELHEAVEALVAREWEQVIDVGAGDGYYAVGLALRLQEATVRCWEMNPLPARACRELARANGVEKHVLTRGTATLDELRALPDVRSLVVFDCEGCEDELLDPEALPLLRRSAVLAEMHDSVASGVEERLKERFAMTHAIETLDVRPRYVSDYPALGTVEGLGYMDQELLVTEFRSHPVRWVVMTPAQAA